MNILTYTDKIFMKILLRLYYNNKAFKYTKKILYNLHQTKAQCNGRNNKNYNDHHGILS